MPGSGQFTPTIGAIHVPVPSEEYGPPHAPHEHAAWWPRAEKIVRKILTWADVRQLSVFGRSGYFVNALLFATVPVNEPVLEVWMRLSENDAAELAKNPRASEHIHPVKGWMRLRVDDDKQIDEAVRWIDRAYNDCLRMSQAGHGVPIEKVPEATGLAEHKIPHGPRSGKYPNGLEIPGAEKQGPLQSNMKVRDLP